MARDELASYLPTICDCSLKTGLVDVHNPSFNLEIKVKKRPNFSSNAFIFGHKQTAGARKPLPFI